MNMITLLNNFAENFLTLFQASPYLIGFGLISIFLTALAFSLLWVSITKCDERTRATANQYLNKLDPAQSSLSNGLVKKIINISKLNTYIWLILALITATDSEFFRYISNQSVMWIFVLALSVLFSDSATKQAVRNKGFLTWLVKA